jgi:hypothetical protein
LTWHAANEYCVSQKSTLASIHSDTENDFIHDLTGGVATWIGLTDTQQNPYSPEDYRWTDNSPSDYKNWNSNESRPERAWYKKDGSNSAPSVCKKPSRKESVGIRHIDAATLLTEGLRSIIVDNQHRDIPEAILTPSPIVTSETIISSLLEIAAIVMRLYLYLSLYLDREYV